MTATSESLRVGNDSSTRPAGVAVLWDFENIHAGLFDREFGNGAYRNCLREGAGRAASRCRGRLFNVEAVARGIEKAVGPIHVHRAYANWPNFRSYFADLYRRAVKMEFVPNQSASKNSADICLAVDAADLVHEHPEITHVVIVSCDGDFSPLAQFLRRKGIKVVGLAVEGARVSELWSKACDRFLRIPDPKKVRKKANAENVRHEPSRTEAVAPPVAPPSQADEYRSLIARQYHLDIAPSALRARLFGDVADLFRDPNAPPTGEAGAEGLENLLRGRLASMGATLTRSLMTDLRQHFWLPRLVRHDGRHWTPQVEPTAEAMERRLVEWVAEKICLKTGGIDVPALRTLLYGPDATTDDGLEQLAAQLKQRFARRAATTVVETPDLSQRG